MSHLRAERHRLRDRYGAFFDEVAAILFRHDPMGINLETNTDEYEPEAGTIIPRLHEAESPADLRRIVHEEFVRWFHAEIAGPEERYDEVAEAIWEAWQRYQVE